MQYVKSITVAAVTLFVLSLSISERQPYAQEHSLEDSEQTFDEEDLPPDSRRVAPDDEFADEDGADEERRDRYPESEEDFSHRDSGAIPSVPSEDAPTSLSSDPNVSPDESSPEESLVVTSGPPALPDMNSLLPREQVAVSFVAAGIEAMDKEDFARARTLFERAIEVAPLQPYSYYFLGKLALNRGEHQKALPLLRKADILLIRGDQAWRSEAMGAQGAVYEDLGELLQARRAYRKSLQLFPQNLRAMSALARLAGEEPDSDDTVSQ